MPGTIDGTRCKGITFEGIRVTFGEAQEIGWGLEDRGFWELIIAIGEKLGQKRSVQSVCANY
jgi:hypothetical protein